VIGVLYLLEIRYGWLPDRRQLAFAWTAQAVGLSLAVAISALLSVWSGFPDPLLHFKTPSSPVLLVLVQVPALYLSMLIGSFFEYWLHRAYHRLPWLWRYHSVHHSLPLGVLNDYSHPLETLLAALFTTIPTMLLIHVETDQISFLVALVYLHRHLSHSRLPLHWGRLRMVLSDNRYHFVHHSLDPAHIGKNFATLPLWDVVCGTYVPAPAGLVSPGLAGRAPPETLLQYLTARSPPHSDMGADPAH